MNSNSKLNWQYSAFLSCMYLRIHVHIYIYMYNESVKMLTDRLIGNGEARWQWPQAIQTNQESLHYSKMYCTYVEGHAPSLSGLHC